MEIFSFSQLLQEGKLVYHTLKIIQPGFSEADGTVQRTE